MRISDWSSDVCSSDLAIALQWLRDDAVGLVLHRPHDHVVGFGNRDTELVDFHRLHVVAVGLYHRHLEPWDADVEVGHGGGVDEPQPNPLAGPEAAGPGFLGILSVHTEGIPAAFGTLGRPPTH